MTDGAVSFTKYRPPPPVGTGTGTAFSLLYTYPSPVLSLSETAATSQAGARLLEEQRKHKPFCLSLALRSAALRSRQESHALERIDLAV